MEFKVGDRFKVVGKLSSNFDVEGQIGTVVRVNSGKKNYQVRFDESSHIHANWSDDGDMQLLEYGDMQLIERANNKSMNLQERVAIAFKGEPEKSFIKAGVMNIDGTLTVEGREVWTAFLVKKFGDEFKTTVIDPMLAEEKAEKAASK